MIDEINTMVRDGNIDDHEALILILRSVGSIHEKLDTLGEKIVKLEDRVEELERHHRDYPSITWLMRYDLRKVIISVVLVLVVSQVIFSPLNISNFREYLLALAGLPTDLGISPP